MADDDDRLVRRLLDLPAGAAVLDVPCGDGRLTVRLAAAGLAATGIDLAEGELALARQAAARAGVRAQFVAGDLRALPDVGRVDGVVSWGNSFGYLTPADSVRSVAGLHRALRPGGRLVLESHTIAESLLVGGVATRAEHEFGGVRMTSRNHYRAEESRLESDLVFEDRDGHVERAWAAHHVHTAGELVRLLRGAGFGAVSLLGADGENPYRLGSARLIAVASV
jgi:SAM-dependent methyltransferase